ncbi:hypothetical protein, partial [Alistipes ihumii]|uniref:hypothetical protein n=1 Tax=Alistipes ihumii TaxID=1470347 RepID=UPI003FEE4F5F
TGIRRLSGESCSRFPRSRISGESDAARRICSCPDGFDWTVKESGMPRALKNYFPVIFIRFRSFFNTFADCNPLEKGGRIPPLICRLNF